LTRRERIVVLLEHLPDYYALGQPGSGTGVDGNLGRFRLAEHESVRELFRCLLLLRSLQPLTYRQLIAFYGAETRVARVRRRRDVPRELRECTPVRYTFEPRSRCYAFRERVLSSAVERSRVERGVSFLLELFEGDVSLPRELLRV